MSSRHRWTNFIKGPNLHDTVDLFNTVINNTEPDPSSSGTQVSEFYNQVISEPSTSTSLSSRSKVIRRRRPPNPVKPAVPAPSFSTLLKLAEADQSEKLEDFLESHVIDLNERDEFGWTLLMVAAVAGSVNSVELFLRQGADYSLQDKKGQTAVDLARKKHRSSVVQVIEKFVEDLKRPKKVSVKCEHQKEEGFCDPCGSNYGDQVVHTKSIVHLLNTTDGVQERTHYGIPESNRGFQLMLRTGWDKQSGLGPEGKGQKFPVKTILKQDRTGLGRGDAKKARITHFGPADPAAVERQVRPGERLERLNTLKKKQDFRLKRKEVRKEIEFRRELGSL